MKRFYFDLVGDLPARDVLGHECFSRKEAKKDACLIAERFGSERPSFAKPGNGISVREDSELSSLSRRSNRLFVKATFRRQGSIERSDRL
jgi:hypothetical protein